MISIKTEEEIDVMREGGRILAQVLERLKTEVKPGVTTEHLDKLGQELILKAHGQPSFKMVRGYHWTTCMSVNEVVVHGIPDSYQLKKGDILGIDIGIFFKGFHTDMSWTLRVQTKNSKRRDQRSLLPTNVGIKTKKDEIDKFLETGQQALEKAIAQAKVGNRVGHISQAIGETISRAGFSPVKALVGHGIGRNLHEEPPIPCFLREPLEKTPLLKEGMTLAIEVIYNQGDADVVYKNQDGWTIQTADDSLSGLFEQTLAISAKGPIVLTRTA